MARKFCYRQRGHDFGPFSADEIRSEAAAGRIDRGAVVWEYGTTTGVYAKDVVGLFSGSNGAKGSQQSKTPQTNSQQTKTLPPPLRQVSDARVFEYVEFVFYKELCGFEEEQRLGVFGPGETVEKQRALLAALRRVGERLRVDTGHLPETDPRPFVSHMGRKYGDPERARRAADSAATNQSDPPLDAALLGALVGSAAAVFAPWTGDPESPQDAPSDDCPPCAESNDVPEARPAGQSADTDEHDTVIEEPTPLADASNSDDPSDIDPEDEALDNTGESFDRISENGISENGVSENWD